MRYARFVRTLSASATAFIGASTLVLGLMAPGAAQSIPGPLKVTDSGPSGSPGYAIKGITGYQNDSGVFGYGTVASSAINIDGVVGYVQTQQSVGVVGWAQSTGTSAYGVYGYSATGPGIYGFNANGGVASIYGSNGSANGIAIWGDSANGTGIFATTDYNGSNAYAAVVAVDNTTDDGFNSGVLGATNSGFYGVEGTSSDEALGGVYGAASTGNGVSGSSSSGMGMLGGSDSNYGIEGTSNSNDGLHGESGTGTGMAGISASGFGSYSKDNGTATPSPGAGPYTYAGAYGQSNEGPGVYGVNLSTTGTGQGYSNADEFAAVYGFGNDGAGVYAYSNSDFGALVTNNSFFPTLYINSDSGTGGADYEIAASAGNIVTDDINFSVDRAGNLFAAGTIFSGTDTYQARTRNPSAKVMTYSSQAAEATVEDFGSAQLVGGAATVALAPDFRKTIDAAATYMVFLTPYGDTHGLYIASRTAAGFTVRESQSGRSTIAFDYRIVAHPYGARHARLPVVPDATVAKFHAGTVDRGHVASARSIARFGMFQPPARSSAQTARMSAKQAAFQRLMLARPGSKGLRGPAAVIPKRPLAPSVHIPKM